MSSAGTNEEIFDWAVRAARDTVNNLLAETSDFAEFMSRLQALNVDADAARKALLGDQL